MQTNQKRKGRSPRVVTGMNLMRCALIGALCYLFIMLTSCGSVKKATNKSETKQKSQSDSSYQTETNIKEVTDTDIVIPSDTTRFEVNNNDSGWQVIETPTNKIVIGPKKKNGKSDLTVINKPKKITVKVDKETTIKAQGAVKKEASTEQKTKDTDKQREQFKIPWWAWLIFAGVILLVLRRFKLI